MKLHKLLGMLLACLCVLHAGCSAFTDPAVRLAYALERTLKQHAEEPGPVQASYNLDVGADYIVVLHPDGNLTDAELAASGLSQAQIGFVRGLRLGTNAAIYVISKDPKTQSSRTTYQMHFIRIPKVMVAEKTASQRIEVSLAGQPGDRFVERIW